jgi:hypothetical protein
MIQLRNRAARGQELAKAPGRIDAKVSGPLKASLATELACRPLHDGSRATGQGSSDLAELPCFGWWAQQVSNL